MISYGSPFKFFLEEVMSGKSGIVYVLAGKVSHRLEKYINPLGNYIYKIEHPAAASHSNTDWKHQGIFNTIDRLLKENNNEHIIWNPKEYYATRSEPPF